MVGKKFPRDPNAPKKPIRPFLYYMMDVSKSVKEEMGLTKGGGTNIRASVSKECGRRWTTMGQEEQEKYIEMFREDSKRYKMAMKDYKPSAEYVEKAKLAKLHNTSVTSQDISSVPHMVRSYFDYLASSWADVAAKLPGLEPQQVQEEVWRRWCEGEPGGSGSGGVGHTRDENQNVVVKKVSKKRNRKKKVDLDTPRAPRLAFQCFLVTMKEELGKHLPDLSYTDMVKHVAAKWKVMSDEQKEPFFELESVEKERYEVQMREKVKKEVEAPIKDVKENDGMKSTHNAKIENVDNVGEGIKVNDVKVGEDIKVNDKILEDQTESDMSIIEGKEEFDFQKSKEKNDLLDSSDDIGDDQEIRSSATRLSFTSSDEDSSDTDGENCGQKKMKDV